jgi:hypothetical protein
VRAVRFRRRGGGCGPAGQRKASAGGCGVTSTKVDIAAMRHSPGPPLLLGPTSPPTMASACCSPMMAAMSSCEGIGRADGFRESLWRGEARRGRASACQPQRVQHRCWQQVDAALTDSTSSFPKNAEGFLSFPPPQKGHWGCGARRRCVCGKGLMFVYVCLGSGWC